MTSPHPAQLVQNSLELYFTLPSTICPAVLMRLAESIFVVDDLPQQRLSRVRHGEIFPRRRRRSSPPKGPSSFAAASKSTKSMETKCLFVEGVSLSLSLSLFPIRGRRRTKKKAPFSEGGRGGGGKAEKTAQFCHESSGDRKEGREQQ